MRLWSLHPKYLDSKGLVALWREALLAQAVLRGETRGYREHPQLERFKEQTSPVSAVARYLQAVRDEAEARGYSFDASKIGPPGERMVLTVTRGQMDHEWRHLLAKLKERSPETYRKWQTTREPEAHPLFRVRAGEVASWERS